MNIALIGSGGREHAICQKLHESKFCNNIICVPGNAGTAKIAKNINIDFLDFTRLLKIIKSNKINLVVVGPEEPLVKGLVDFLVRHKVKVFGPNKYAAKLEGSKAFMKAICKNNNIPTAQFKICKNLKNVKSFLTNSSLPIVVKADGLAAGKGVTICNNKKQVLNVSNEIFKGKFKSSKKLVLEEFLEGEEASYFLVVDKNNFKFFGSAQDHKRVKEKDLGPNTGGMGAYSPAPIITKEIEKKIIDQIIIPTIQGMNEIGCKYKGILYAGLMIKNNEPKLIEYNIRFGDPECQALMMRLDDDLLDIILSCVEEKLDNKPIKWSSNPSITIVAASRGYPESYKTKEELKNIPKSFVKNEQMFHAGTVKIDEKILSNGGRVLNSTVSLPTMKASRNRAIELLNQVKWENKYFRKDIGWRVIK